MKNSFKILILVIVLLSAVVFFLSKNKEKPSPFFKRTTITTPIPISLAPMTTSKPSSDTMRINLYFIALNDKGKLGTKVGCDDSLVAIQKNLPPTKTPLSAVITDLLSLNTQYYGEEKFYNALYQSNLKLSSVILNPNGETLIKLSGTPKPGGACEGPRIIAQLRQTALQFPAVKELSIYIGDKKIEDVFSQK